MVVARDFSFERSSEIEVLTKAADSIGEMLIRHGQQVMGVRIVNVERKQGVWSVGVRP
jgi:hypothetical protein